jgi:hypothetical protein
MKKSERIMAKSCQKWESTTKMILKEKEGLKNNKRKKKIWKIINLVDFEPIKIDLNKI